MEQHWIERGAHRRLGAVMGGVLAGAFALLSAGNAYAVGSYFVPKQESNTWTMGNSAFSTSASLIGTSSANGYLSDGRRTYDTTGKEYAMVIAEVFGKRGIIVDAQTGGAALSRSTRRVEVSSTFKVLGNTVWSASSDGNDAACPGTEVVTRGCTRLDKNWSKTFFQISQDFPVSIFTINVAAQVKGGLRAHLGTDSIVMQGPTNNKQDHIGAVTSDAGVGAYATAVLSADISLASPDFLSVGVSAEFALIDVNATAAATVLHHNHEALRKTVSTWNLGLDITSMNGKVDVYGVVTPLWKPRTTLIDVDGFHKYIPIAEKSVTTQLAVIDL